MYDQILLSTDGTVASEKAESHAVALADAHDALFHVLYVVDEDVVTVYSGDEYVDETGNLAGIISRIDLMRAFNMIQKTGSPPAVGQSDSEISLV